MLTTVTVEGRPQAVLVDLVARTFRYISPPEALLRTLAGGARDVDGALARVAAAGRWVSRAFAGEVISSLSGEERAEVAAALPPVVLPEPVVARAAGIAVVRGLAPGVAPRGAIAL